MFSTVDFPFKSPNRQIKLEELKSLDGLKVTKVG